MAKWRIAVYMYIYGGWDGCSLVLGLSSSSFNLAVRASDLTMLYWRAAPLQGKSQAQTLLYLSSPY